MAKSITFFSFFAIMKCLSMSDMNVTSFRKLIIRLSESRAVQSFSASISPQNVLQYWFLT